jgi:hypothetical protein
MDLERLERELEALGPELKHARREAEAAAGRLSLLNGRAIALGIAIEQECYRCGLPQLMPDGREFPHPASPEARRTQDIAAEASKHLPPDVIPDAQAMAEARKRLGK